MAQTRKERGGKNFKINMENRNRARGKERRTKMERIGCSFNTSNCKHGGENEGQGGNRRRDRNEDGRKHI